jgi:hypothetical protein
VYPQNNNNIIKKIKNSKKKKKRAMLYQAPEEDVYKLALWFVYTTKMNIA